MTDQPSGAPSLPPTILELAILCADRDPFDPKEIEAADDLLNLRGPKVATSVSGTDYYGPPDVEGLPANRRAGYETLSRLCALVHAGNIRPDLLRSSGIGYPDASLTRLNPADALPVFLECGASAAAISKLRSLAAALDAKLPSANQPSNPGRRGRPPEATDAVIRHMRRDLELGRMSEEKLRGEKQEALARRYEVSRKTAVKARATVLNDVPNTRN